MTAVLGPVGNNLKKRDMLTICKRSEAVQLETIL